MDLLQKVAESRRNAGLNPDTEEEKKAASDDGASRDERVVACPKPIIHEEKAVPIIFISTTVPESEEARQLP